jgi:hypothetical protein
MKIQSFPGLCCFVVEKGLYEAFEQGERLNWKHEHVGHDVGYGAEELAWTKSDND